MTLQAVPHSEPPGRPKSLLTLLREVEQFLDECAEPTS
ncbi:hypothetical protein OK006_10207 [Actinobacteria bacterium OK006]|nr:hypothetical protein OK006_10207 [Actinobacteria bacterium OK006]